MQSLFWKVFLKRLLCPQTCSSVWKCAKPNIEVTQCELSDAAKMGSFFPLLMDVLLSLFSSVSSVLLASVKLTSSFNYIQWLWDWFLPDRGRLSVKKKCVFNNRYMTWQHWTHNRFTFNVHTYNFWFKVVEQETNSTVYFKVKFPLWRKCWIVEETGVPAEKASCSQPSSCKTTVLTTNHHFPPNTPLKLWKKKGRAIFKWKNVFVNHVWRIHICRWKVKGLGLIAPATWGWVRTY